jgi:hypothetical protein
MFDRKTQCAATAFLALLVLGGVLEMHALRRDGEARLKRDAQTLAARAALQLAGVVREMDAPGARASLFAEMEDARLAGMLIHDREGFLEGMRRNARWESVPWDDLIPENAEEAESPVMMEDTPIGRVTVYLSRRSNDEELSAACRRELLRVGVLSLFPCAVLAPFLRRPVPQRAGGKTPPAAPRDAEGDHPDVRRAFAREMRAVSAPLYLAAAREDWAELRSLAADLHETALRLAPPENGDEATGGFAAHVRRLAEAALALREASLGDTKSAARRVEECSEALSLVLEHFRLETIAGRTCFSRYDEGSCGRSRQRCSAAGQPFQGENAPAAAAADGRQRKARDPAQGGKEAA